MANLVILRAKILLVGNSTVFFLNMGFILSILDYTYGHLVIQSVAFRMFLLD